MNELTSTNWDSHQFFHDIFSRSNSQQYCYGLSDELSPTSPFLFQKVQIKEFSFLGVHSCPQIEDEKGFLRKKNAMFEIIDDFIAENITRHGQKFYCRIENCFFSNEINAISHIKNAHKKEIQQMLKQLMEDMEQLHLGNIFTKIFYSDLWFPISDDHHVVSPQYPSVVAPFFERKEPSKKAKKRTDACITNSKDKRDFRATSIFSDEEIASLERAVFGYSLGSIHTQDEEKVILEAENTKIRKEREEALVAKANNDSNGAAQNTVTSQKTKPTTEKKDKEKEEPLLTQKENISEEKENKKRKKNKKKGKKKEEQEKPQEISDKQSVTEMKKSDSIKQKKEQDEEKEEAKQTIEQKQYELIEIDRKFKKQIEDKLTSELLEDVVVGLCEKLGYRTLQEIKKKQEKERAEQALKQQNEEKEKEKRNQERKLRREMRKKEAEKVLEEIMNEEIMSECTTCVKQVLQEQKQFQKAPTFLNTNYPMNYPQYGMPVTNPTSGDPFFQAENFPMEYLDSSHQPIGSDPYLLSLNGQPMNVLNNGTYETHPSFTLGDFMNQPNIETSEDAEFSETKEYQEGAQIGHYSMNPHFPFFSYLPSQEATNSEVSLDSPGSIKHSNSGLSTEESPQFLPSNSNSHLLQSIPEDFDLNPNLSIVCKNIPPNSKKGEIASFFRDCTISLAPDFSTQIVFLKGTDTGCCFVQFETQDDINKALSKNGQKLGGYPIWVTRPIGALTSESGQKFALNIKTRNVETQISDFKPNNESHLARSTLNPIAPEFKPSFSKLSEKEVAQDVPEPQTLSSLLNTEQDDIVTSHPHQRKASSSSLVVGDKITRKTAQEQPDNNLGLEHNNFNSRTLFSQTIASLNSPVGLFPSLQQEPPQKNEIATPAEEAIFMTRFGSS